MRKSSVFALPRLPALGGSLPFGPRPLPGRVRLGGSSSLSPVLEVRRMHPSRGVSLLLLALLVTSCAGPAKLALSTGAALFPAHCWYEGDGWGCRIYPELDTSSGDVTAITQALADRFAVNIAAYPADWHMMQPQWLADLSDERRARLLGGLGAPPACGGERSEPGIGEAT